MHGFGLRRLIAPSLAALVAASGAHAAPRAENTAGARERTLAVGVYQRQDGHLTPTDAPTLRARIGDHEAAVTSRVALVPDPSRGVTEPILTHPWRLVIYVDPALLTADGQQRSMAALAHHAGRLTALGTVEVVVADPLPITTLEATRDPQLVVRALRAAGPVRPVGAKPGTLDRIRRRFQTAVPELGGAWSTAQLDALDPLFERLRDATQQEERLLTERLGRLSDWLLMHPAPAPAALIWPTSGWDTDPASFYLAGLVSDTPKKRRRAGRRARRDATMDGLGEDGLGGGSLTMSLNGLQDPVPSGSVFPARPMRETLMREMPATGDLGEGLAQDIVRAGYVALPIHAASVSPVAWQTVNRPLLLTLAQATGSRIALTFDSVGPMLDDLRHRWLVTLRLPPETLEHPEPLLFTTGHAQQVVKAPSWLMPRSPELLARRQTLALHAGLVDKARRSRSCQVERRAVRIFEGAQRVIAALSCRVHTSLPAAAARDERPTFLELVVTEGARDAPRIVHQETIRFRPAGEDEPTDNQELDGDNPFAQPSKTMTGIGRTLRRVKVDTMLALAPETKRVGIFVRLGGTERWSSRAIPVVDGDVFTAEPSATRALALGPAIIGQAAIKLVPLDAVVVAGRTLIEAQVFHRGVDRVVYRLDGEPKGEAGKEPRAISTQAPFRVWLDLPTIPVPMTLSATALNADGERLGEDRLALNQSYDRLRVTILEPTRIESPGRYEVAVDASAGLAQPSVDLFWNERLLTTLDRPPYRAQLDVPAVQRGDFLRATVRREGDAAYAEDVVVVGSDAYSEEMPVNLIELFTVVEDRRGLPIADLGPNDFQVQEDGHEQTLASFADASEMPLTVALALDVSDSMRAALPWVKKAAQSFVRDVLKPGDRAMLIAFDQRPALRLTTTDDLGRLVSAIDDLDLGFGTALHDTVIFGLLQLRTIPGRKALVVLTDGVDQHSHLTESAMLASARRAGIPIYVLRMRDSGPSVYGATLLPLRRMAKRSGAGLFRVEDPSSLTKAYDTIARELRSQYLLTYHSNQPTTHTGWREIEVQLLTSGLRARTIPGYEHRP